MRILKRRLSDAVFQALLNDQTGALIPLDRGAGDSALIDTARLGRSCRREGTVSIRSESQTTMVVWVRVDSGAR